MGTSARKGLCGITGLRGGKVICRLQERIFDMSSYPTGPRDGWILREVNGKRECHIIRGEGVNARFFHNPTWWGRGIPGFPEPEEDAIITIIPATKESVQKYIKHIAKTKTVTKKEQPVEQKQKAYKDWEITLLKKENCCPGCQEYETHWTHAAKEWQISFKLMWEGSRALLSGLGCYYLYEIQINDSKIIATYRPDQNDDYDRDEAVDEFVHVSNQSWQPVYAWDRYHKGGVTVYPYEGTADLHKSDWQLSTKQQQSSDGEEPS